jgi:hypothetical protein
MNNAINNLVDVQQSLLKILVLNGTISLTQLEEEGLGWVSDLVKEDVSS